MKQKQDGQSARLKFVNAIDGKIHISITQFSLEIDNSEDWYKLVCRKGRYSCFERLSFIELPETPLETFQSAERSDDWKQTHHYSPHFQQSIEPVNRRELTGLLSFLHTIASDVFKRTDTTFSKRFLNWVIKQAV